MHIFSNRRRPALYFRRGIICLGLLYLSLPTHSQVGLTLNIPQSNARFIVRDSSGDALFTVANNMLFRWDIRTGRCLQQEKLHGQLRRMKLSPGKKYFITAEESGDDSFLGIYGVENIKQLAFIKIDSLTEGGKRFLSERRVENIDINEKTGWVAGVMYGSVFFYNFFTGQKIFIETPGIYGLSAVAPYHNDWLIAGSHYTKDSVCIWRIRLSETNRTELITSFKKTEYITELISAPESKSVMAVVEGEKIYLLEGQPVKRTSIKVPKDFWFYDSQFSWEKDPLRLQIVDDAGACVFYTGSRKFKKVAKDHVYLNYFVLPFDNNEKLFIDKGRDYTTSLLAFDYIPFDDNDTTFLERSVVSYGNNNMVRFTAMKKYADGQYLLTDVNNLSVLDLNHLRMLPAYRGQVLGYIPLYRFLFLPQSGKPAEVFWHATVKNETVYSLMEFNERGYVDSIYPVLTLPPGEGLLTNPLFFPGYNSDSLFIINTEGKKMYITRRGENNQSVSVPLPEKIAKFPPAYENRFLPLPNGHFLFAADLLINYDVNNKAWKIIDQQEQTKFSLLAYDSVKQILLYKNDDKGHIKRYSVLTGDTATLLGSRDVFNIRLIRPFAWNGEEGNWLVVTRDGQAQVRNQDLSKIFYSFTIEKNVTINDLFEDKDKGLLFFLLNDYSMRVFDADNYKQVAKIYFNKQRNEYYALAFDDDNNYFMPARQTAMVNWTYKNKAYDFSAFDGYFNKPATLLRKLRSSDSAYIGLLEKATATRLKRMRHILEANKLDELPQCTISNDAIPFVIDSSNVNIPIHIRAGKDTVNRFQVFINYVPVLYKQAGFFKNPIPPGMDTTFMFTASLTPDRSNNISIRAFDNEDKGSLPAETNVYRMGANVKRASKKWYLGIGISRYKNSAYNLKYAAKDVKDIGKNVNREINDTYRGGSLVITDSLVTVNNVIKGFTWLASNATTDDVVIISFSGHGVTERDGKFYFMMYNTDFNKPDSISLPSDILFEMLRILPCRNKLVLLDACESGDFDEEGFLTTQKPAKTEIIDTAGARGIKVKSTRNSGYLELMKEYFADLSTESGATIIGASSGTSLALENDAWKNGIFSYTFMQGLFGFKADMNNDKKITIGELRDYMAREVENLSGGKQQPSVRNMDLRNDWIIVEKRQMRKEK